MPEVIGVKPTRSTGAPKWSQIPHTRRSVLFSTAILLLMLTSMILYQRWVTEPDPSPDPATFPSETAAGGEQPEQEVGVERSEPLSASTVHPGQQPDTARPPEVLLRPVPGAVRVLSDYGPTYSDLYGDFRYNTGVALEAALDEPVLAAADGTVASVEDHPADGRVVTVRHSGGMVTRYAGLGEVAVQADQQVQAGDILGKVGSPGLEREDLGPHLYFEVLLDGEALDPLPFLSE